MVNFLSVSLGTKSSVNPMNVLDEGLDDRKFVLPKNLITAEAVDSGQDLLIHIAFFNVFAAKKMTS